MKQFIAILCLLWAPLLLSAETQVMNGVDDGTYHVELGHEFPYYGGVFTDAWMSSNGFIILYDPTTGYGNSNTSQSWCQTCGWGYSGGPPQGKSNLSFMIAPMWSDFRHITNIADSGYFYETGEDGTWFEWRNVREYGTTNLNTFGLQLYPGGSFDFHYADVNVTQHDVWIGFTGDTTSLNGNVYDEVNELFYNDVSVDGSMQTSDVTDFTDATTNFGYAWWGDDGGYSSVDCSNPLNDTSCDGYAAAYQQQQCNSDPLYDTECDGYAAAYQQQQCNSDPLYDTECDGYAQAWLDQECQADAQFSPSCSGYDFQEGNDYDDGSQQHDGSHDGSMDGSMDGSDGYMDGSDGYMSGSDEYMDDGNEDGMDDNPMGPGPEYEEPQYNDMPGTEEEIFSVEENSFERGPSEENPYEETIPDQPEVYREEQFEQEREELFDRVASDEIDQEEIFEEPIFDLEVEEPDLEAEFERELERPERESPEPEMIEEYERVEEEFFAEEVPNETLEERIVRVAEEPEEKEIEEKPAPAKPEERLEATPRDVAIAINIAKDTLRGLLELNTPLTQDEQLALDIASTEPPSMEMENHSEEVQVAEAQQTQEAQQDNQQVEEDFGDNSSDQTIDQTFGDQMTQSFAAGGNIGTFLSGQQPDYSRFEVQLPPVDVQVDVAKVENAVQGMSSTEVQQNATNLTQQMQSSGGFDEDQSLAVTVMGFNPDIQTYDNVVLPDRDQFYRSEGVYNGNENTDNMGAMYRMMGRGNRLHSELVNQQYEGR